MMFYLAPSLRKRDIVSSAAELQEILANRAVTLLLAQFCYRVLNIYESTPMYLPL